MRKTNLGVSGRYPQNPIKLEQIPCHKVSGRGLVSGIDILDVPLNQSVFSKNRDLYRPILHGTTLALKPPLYLDIIKCTPYMEMYAFSNHIEYVRSIDLGVSNNINNRSIYSTPNIISRKWYQHVNPIWFDINKPSCDQKFFDVLIEILKKTSPLKITVSHHTPLKAVIYHCIWSTCTNRPIEAKITNKRALKTVIKGLKNVGLLDFRIGRSNVDEGYWYNSKFQPTERFKAVLVKLNIPLKDIKDVRQIVTKDSEGNEINRQAIDPNTPDGILIQEYNDFIKKQDIKCTFKPGDFKAKDHRYGLTGCINVNSQISRIFTDQEGDGGRLYNQGALQVQQLSEIVRGRITINSNPTTELDFDELHPNMSYHSGLGLNAPAKNYMIYSNDPAGLLRKCVKKGFNTIINSKTHGEAVKAVRKAFYCDKPNLGKALDGHFGGKYKRPTDRIEQMISDIKNHHSAIQHCFYSSAWKTLQHEDSEMLLEILTALRKINIIALPVHDSVVIEEEHVATAKKVMEMIYAKHYGFGIGVS